MVELFANSGDPDHMPHSAASDLGLYFFANYPFKGSSVYNGLSLCRDKHIVGGTVFYKYIFLLLLF